MSKVLPWPLYSIQSNMGQIFYPIWMNPDQRCVCSPVQHACHCFLSMCRSLHHILFQPGIRHLVFINAKRDARCARFVYVNICKMSWINTLMTSVWVWTLFTLSEKCINRFTLIFIPNMSYNFRGHDGLSWGANTVLHKRRQRHL